MIYSFLSWDYIIFLPDLCCVKIEMLQHALHKTALEDNF